MATTKVETVAKMDNAAIEASEAITAEDITAFKKVAGWWDNWYRQTGHKRLGRLLLEYRDVHVGR